MIQWEDTCALTLVLRLYPVANINVDNSAILVCVSPADGYQLNHFSVLVEQLKLILPSCATLLSLLVKTLAKRFLPAGTNAPLNAILEVVLLV